MADEPELTDDEPTAVPDQSDRLLEVHRRAMARMDSLIAQQEMRAESLADRRFVTIPGAQWEGPWGDLFENAPRPEVDKITKSLEKIETDYRQNRLTVDFVPATTDADEGTAETLDGIHRADAYQYKAQQGRDNAFQEGIRGGFGAYRLATIAADPDDPENDQQRINPALAIVDADQSVFFDGASKLYDKSDAKWAFIVTADPRMVVEDRWPDVTEWPTNTLNMKYEWWAPDVIRTAEYYDIETVADTLLIYKHAQGGADQRYYASELDKKARRDLKAQGWKATEKPSSRRRVHKYILDGSRVLKDCGYIAGRNIPIVPFYGRRDYVDTMERWRGHVGKLKDRQRIYNTRIAKLTETDSTASSETPVFAPDQITPGPMMTSWERRHLDRPPYLTANPLLDPLTGGIAATGPMFKLEPPQVPQVTAALLTIASQDLTENDDQADQVRANVSADAMDIAAARVDAKSGIYLDNMRQTVQREAEIYLDMAREVYFEPGRVVDTLSEDNQDGTATLGETTLGEDGAFKVRNDLTQGRYRVIADVTEATSTRRAKTVKESLNLASVATAAQDMELAQVALLTATMNMDGEGTSDMQAWARKQLVGKGVVKPTAEEQQAIQQAQAAQGQQPPSPQDQALIAAAQAQGAQAQLSMAKAVQAKADAHLKIAQAEALGGPEKAPEVPSGLSAANDAAAVADTAASARLKDAQAAKIVHGIHDQRLRTGAELTQGAHDRMMAERAQVAQQGNT